MSSEFENSGASPPPDTTSLTSSKSLVDLNQLTCAPVSTDHVNYLTKKRSYNLDTLIQLTSIDNQKALQKMLHNSILIKGACKMSGAKKNNSISDSSTTDSDSGYMEEESETEFLPFVTDEDTPDDDDENLTRPQKMILSGFAGRAKNDSLPTLTNFSTTSKSLLVNYGDDVGFVHNKNLNEAEFMPPRSQLTDSVNDLEMAQEDPAHLVNKYYFGLADGVSANRLRGYDAKLFPNALMSAAMDACDKSAEYYTNYAINLKAALMREMLQKEEDNLRNELNENIEQLVIFKNEEYDGTEAYEYEEEDQQEDEEEENNDNEYNTYETLDQPDSQIEMSENDCDKLKGILNDAHDIVEDNKVYGSSTVCLLSLEFYDTSEFSLLSSCNVGDSGYMVVRDKKVLFKSQSQSHRYNAPYQLGCTPPELIEHHLYRDKAEDAICHSHLVKSGDFVLISSDGMFDNLYEDEIALIIDQSISSFKFSNSTLKITTELLNSICHVLVQKASKAGIKQDDMLVMLIYID